MLKTSNYTFQCHYYPSKHVEKSQLVLCNATIIIVIIITIIITNNPVYMTRQNEALDIRIILEGQPGLLWVLQAAEDAHGHALEVFQL